MAKRKYIPQEYTDNSGDNQEDSSRFHDLGFSSAVVKNRKRYINKDGSFNIARNSKGFGELHIYQWLVVMNWASFFVATIFFYTVINVFFACMYLMVGVENLAGVAGEDLSSFWRAFFFSVQTSTTVGYGSLSPIGFGANIVAALGALTGLMSFALGTGILFARFSKPRASISFSQNALITPYEKGMALMFRLANKRKNMLTNLRVEVIATWVGVDEHGNEKRNYKPLKLERDNLTMLPLSWTVVHPIDESSPLAVCTKKTCETIDLEIIVILEGYDDTFANIIRAHSSYKYSEIIWNAKFDTAFYFDENGRTVLELEKLDDYTVLGENKGIVNP
jgi:inward rectifier potassium channel